MFKKSKQILATLLTIAMLITPAPITAYADATQDGDNQQGVAGSDVSKDYNVDTSAFGCWRLYMARREDGGIVGTVKDVGNVDSPSIDKGCDYNGIKLHTRGGNSGGGSTAYACVPVIPPLGSGIAELKAFWERENYANIKTIAPNMAWSEEMIQKFISGEYVIVMEPVAWFTYGGMMFSMSATECANFNIKLSGDLKKYLGSFTHNEIPGYAWLEQQSWWGIPMGYSYSTDGMNFHLTDSTIQSTFGISIVYSLGGMCCPQVRLGQPICFHVLRQAVGVSVFGEEIILRAK